MLAQAPRIHLAMTIDNRDYVYNGLETGRYIRVMCDVIMESGGRVVSREFVIFIV